MTWDELKQEYFKRCERYVPKSKLFAEQGLVQLEYEMQQRFPEAYENPFLLIETEWAKVYNRFGSRKDTDRVRVSGKCMDALIRTRRILNHIYNFKELEAVELTASLSLFGKKEVMYCCSLWMQLNGYTTIIRAQSDTELRDITAEKDGFKFTCKALTSVWREGADTNLFEDEKAFKASLGRIIVFLMEELHSDKNNKAVILIADDRATKETMGRFLKYIKKTGIRVFAVQSAQLVVEL